MNSLRAALVFLSFCTFLGCVGEAHTGSDELPPAPVPPVETTPPPAAPADAGSPPVIDPGPPPALVDDAAVVSVTIPAALACGEQQTATLTLRNTGTSTWKASEKVRLGAIDDADPLSAVGRVDLEPGEAIAPGQTKTFTLTLVAPRQMASLTSDWRMLREDVRWFGATVVQPVAVAACNEDAIDLSQVQVFNSPTDVASWAITTHLERLEMHPENDIGLVFTFPAQQTWPDYTPPGGTGRCSTRCGSP